MDIVAILTEQPDFQKSRKYWNKLGQRLKEEGREAVTNCHQLKLPAEDGKLRLTDCANVKTIFRVIQSIPSKKAEPFKQWLAQLGKERIDEIENPEVNQRILPYLNPSIVSKPFFVIHSLRNLSGLASILPYP